MTIAGTIMVIGYMLLKFLYQNRIESKWKIYFLRVAVVIYLFPFQLSKYSILPQKMLDKTRVREWITQNLHWYNPFAYYILWEYTNVCEQYCDEECMQYASKEERKQYAIFLVKSALVDNQQKICLFSSGLTNGGEKMKNRIDNFLKDSEVKKQHKQLKKVLALIMMLSFTTLSSLTVCAYDCPQEQGFVWDENIRCIEGEENYYGKTEVEISEASDFSTYDTLCIDENGNISVVQETITKSSKCSHNYKSIKMIEKHSKLKNGSCEVKMYKGKKCSKCGKVVPEREEYAVLEHRECPHKK